MAHKVVSRLDDLRVIPEASWKTSLRTGFAIAVILFVLLWAIYKKFTPLHVEETPQGQARAYLDGSEAKVMPRE